MTYESEIAKQNAVYFEGWKWKITEQKGGMFRIPFDVKSKELPEDIKNAPVGTRFMIAVVEIGDNEEPVQKPKSYAQQAKMLAKDDLFYSYLRDVYKVISTNQEFYLKKKICGVESCSKLLEGTEAGRKFKELQSEFGRWKVQLESRERQYERD